MADHTLNTVGMKCPQPLLKLAVKAPQVKAGESLEIIGDCPTFESDVRTWCSRVGKTLQVVTSEGKVVSMTIRF